MLQVADVHMKWWYAGVSAGLLRRKKLSTRPKGRGKCPGLFALVFWTYFAFGVLIVASEPLEKMPK